MTDELNDKNAEFYFAELDSKIIGYLKLNFGPSQTELKDDKALEIERIYVLKEFHGNKVGQLLYEKAIQIARQTNADYVWLGVWELRGFGVDLDHAKIGANPHASTIKE